MHKTGEITPGNTPVEEGVKAASEKDLEDHLTKRTAAAAEQKIADGKGCCGGKCGDDE